MADQVTVLQLVLNQLHLNNSITTIDDRIAIQKVVCLTQEAGLQLGYSFNWYVRGPYSPALASDYYQLSASQATVEQESQKFVLTESASSAVQRVAQVLNPPVEVALERVGWLELAASVVFLVKRHRLSIAAARAKIELSKPRLAPYFQHAITALNNAGFNLG